MDLTFAARAQSYAESVVAGEIPACEYVRLACQRHLDDLNASDSPYYFDDDAANKLGEFMELMPHVKGMWAKREELLKLEDWQCFGFLVPFGWKRKADGMRRFRRVYHEWPRKQAKSTGTAAVANFMFTEDDEFGAEVYSGATSEEQAWEVFGPARLMVKGRADLRNHYGVDVNAKNMVRLGANSKFKPVIGKPGDGASPHFSVTDEYHEHATSEQYDTMVTGMGSREQPMAWVITTAGDDTAGPCYELRGELVNMLTGAVEDDELFGLIYTIDDGDAWDSVDSLRKANPNMGVSVFEDYLIAQQRLAINNPRKQSTFKTKHLNVWVTAASPYFNLEKWNRLADAPPIETWKGQDCYGGVDLTAKIDTASYVKVFRKEIDGEQHYYVYSRTYVPEERAEGEENRHYAGWAASGHLILAGEARLDYDLIEEDVKEDAETVGLMLGVDPWNATQFITHMQKHLGDDRVVEVPQTVNHISEPMKEVGALIESGHIHHTGSPVQSWMIGNVTAKEDHKGNVYPRKPAKEKKIDFAVALFDAFALILRHPPPPKSRYEDPDAEIASV